LRVNPQIFIRSIHVTVGAHRQRNQGRTASYPTAPSQIPACGITAPGSSDLLTYLRLNPTLRSYPGIKSENLPIAYL
jgi:hypothetical protein